MKRAMTLAGLAAMALWGCASASVPAQAVPLEEVELRLEYNATDDDAEVVLVIDAGVDLERLRMFAPGGRNVLSLSATTFPGLGAAKLLVETPEPSMQEVLASYPAGRYGFRGVTVDGRRVTGHAVLSHELPVAPVITAPLADGEVPVAGLTAEWQPVPGAAAYVVGLEQEEMEIELVGDVPAAETSFALPAAWLRPDTDYKLEVVAIGDNGNRTVTEARFHTAE